MKKTRSRKSRDTVPLISFIILRDFSVEAGHLESAVADSVTDLPGKLVVLHAYVLQLLRATVLHLLHANVLQLLHATVLQLLHATVLQLLHAPVLQLLHSTILQLFHATVLQLLHATVLQLLHATVLQLLHATVLQLLHATVLQLLHATYYILLSFNYYMLPSFNFSFLYAINIRRNEGNYWSATLQYLSTVETMHVQEVGTVTFGFTVHKMLDILLQLVIEKYRDFCSKNLKRASTKIFDWLEK
jgi:hypothetical protein